jgi:hypothetical protein
MKQIIKSYSVEDEKNRLIYIDVYCEYGLLIKSTDYRCNPQVENQYEYNDEGKLIQHKEIENGVEISTQLFAYNASGDIILQELHICGTLYEKTVLELTENYSIKTMFQDNVEIERLEKELNGRNWVNNFYVNNELVETQTYVYDAITSSGKTTISAPFEKDTFYILEKYNEMNEVIFFEEYKQNKLLKSIESTYKNQRITFEKVHDYSNGEVYYQNTYEYDSKGNTIKFECRNLSGKLINFHHCSYDNQNRLIEEIGINKIVKDNFKADYDKLNRFHTIFEYETIV